MAEAQRFEVRFGFWRPLLTQLGTGPRRTELAIDGKELIVRMGWAFRTSIPIGSIQQVVRDPERPWFGVGVHGWRGTWTVNGALGPIVAIEIESPARARLLGFVGVRVRHLRVSVVDPDEVVTALTALTALTAR